MASAYLDARAGGRETIPMVLGAMGIASDLIAAFSLLVVVAVQARGEDLAHRVPRTSWIQSLTPLESASITFNLVGLVLSCASIYASRRATARRCSEGGRSVIGTQSRAGWLGWIGIVLALVVGANLAFVLKQM